jgi:hypothetical protein
MGGNAPSALQTGGPFLKGTFTPLPLPSPFAGEPDEMPGSWGKVQARAGKFQDIDGLFAMVSKDCPTDEDAVGRVKSVIEVHLEFVKAIGQDELEGLGAVFLFHSGRRPWAEIRFAGEDLIPGVKELADTGTVRMFDEESWSPEVVVAEIGELAALEFLTDVVLVLDGPFFPIR